MTHRILLGDCLETLKTLPDCSVQTCVTSPPYFGLRNYGTETWEGGDPDCNHASAKEKSRYDYPMQEGSRHSEIAKTTKGTDGAKYVDVCPACGAVKKDLQIGLEQSPEEYIQKLVSVFREVRRVLKDDGVLWLNLGDSFWGGKGQSGQAWSTEHQDRDTLEQAHHQISGKGETRPTDGKHAIYKPKDLMMIPARVALALQSDGWWLRSEIIWHKPNPMPESVTDRPTKSHEMIYLLAKSQYYFYDAEAIKEPTICDDPREIQSGLIRGRLYGYDSKERKLRKNDSLNTGGNGSAIRNHNGNSLNTPDGKRNKRDVWTVPTKPYSGAHFATFPPDLIGPCILAGSRIGDTVLDPFNGSGTTGAVSIKHGRDYIGCELNPEYIELTMQRLAQVQPVMGGLL